MNNLCFIELLFFQFSVDSVKNKGDGLKSLVNSIATYGVGIISGVSILQIKGQIHCSGSN